MEPTVLFRDFEERDIDFVYKCKNDEKLNSMIVGQFKPFSREDAEKWVHGCMGEHDNFKFWAICTNNEEKRIVGWMAISQIDRVNKSVFTHSIVVNDPDYNDGYAWIESVLHMFSYSFDKLGMNRVWGESVVGHPMSRRIGPLLFMTNEGTMRQASYKNGYFVDLQIDAILREEYYSHRDAGDYDMMKIIRRLRKILKEEKKL